MLDPGSDSIRLQRQLMKRKSDEEYARTSIPGVREQRARHEGLSLLPHTHANNKVNATDLLAVSPNSKDSPGGKSREGRVISWTDNSDRNRMLVCDAFLRKACTLSCCPLAHPGLRDSALVTRQHSPAYNTLLISILSRAVQLYTICCGTASISVVFTASPE